MLMYAGITPRLSKYVIRLFDKVEHVNICPSHDFVHMITVRENAKRALNFHCFPQNIRDAIELSALLHDVDDKKFFNTENYQNAREILDGHPDEELIIEMIDLVSMSKNKNSLVEPSWKLIPRYCDRIEALGNVGIERMLKYNETIGRPIHVETTERAYNLSDLRDIIEKRDLNSYDGKSPSMIDHIYSSILHIEITEHNPFLLKVFSTRYQETANYLIKYWKNLEKEGK